MGVVELSIWELVASPSSSSSSGSSSSQLDDDADVEERSLRRTAESSPLKSMPADGGDTSSIGRMVVDVCTTSAVDWCRIITPASNGGNVANAVDYSSL